jgi:large subunit ribosomal protein L22
LHLLDNSELMADSRNQWESRGSIMISKASATYVRLSPQKARYVADLIRNKSVLNAYSILDRTTRKPTENYKKLIQSAVDTATKLKEKNIGDLYISKVVADSAGMMKRWRSMTMGKAGMIRKRMSHLTVELDVRVKNTKPQDNSTKPKSNAKKILGAAK